MPNQFANLAKRVRDLDQDLRDDLGDEANESAKRSKRAAKENLEKKDAIATRELHAGLHVKTPDLFLSGQRFTAKVQSRAAHGKLVERGTGVFSHTDSPFGYDAPSYVNDKFAENIQQWIEAKGVTGRVYSPVREDDGSPSELAWAIARTIVDQGGTPAQPFMGPAFRQTKSTNTALISQRLSDTMRSF